VTAADSLTEQRLDALLDAVLGQVKSDDPRLNEVVTSLVRHLHAFVRETRPTETEWLTGIDFLVRTGHTCTDQRNEFILLADMLGLTSAVDDVNHAGPTNATPSSVEGPFHAPAPPRENGDWVSNGPERQRGETMVVRGRVTDTDGKPIEGATVDIWQADDAGHYDSQDAIVGRQLTDVDETAAMDGVLGYATFNDLTARTAQKLTAQWTLGKNADRSRPIGPILTADEVGDLSVGLRVRTRVNGEIVQDGSTKDMIFGVGDLLSRISRTFTLNPGDVIATGTPESVGYVRTPPWLLHPGDVVEVEVDRLGVVYGASTTSVAAE
jgi:Fumarylacetoacetate (FAA) hydrolase family/Catechol dioxygenase N terminus/Dioxygenase